MRTRRNRAVKGGVRRNEYNAYSAALASRHRTGEDEDTILGEPVHVRHVVVQPELLEGSGPSIHADPAERVTTK
jgi:hypothetical protein